MDTEYIVREIKSGKEVYFAKNRAEAIKVIEFISIINEGIKYEIVVNGDESFEG